MKNYFSKSNNELKIWTSGAPFSLDPTEYDYFGHHTAFRSVYASLVSSYGPKQHQPIIASNWEVVDNGKTWKFFIRPNLLFSDDSVIGPAAVYKSLNRALFILKQKNSHSPLIENLKGYKGYSNLSVGFSGLTFDSTSISLHYDEPNYSVLDSLAFGFFGIMPENCWDQNGRWKISGFDCPTSGAYTIKAWDKDHISLKLRKNLPDGTTSKSPPEYIKISWHNQALNDFDVVIGSSNLSLNDMAFTGPTESGIFFIRVVPYDLKSHPLSDPNTRRWLKNKFYLSLEDIFPKNKKNFLPDAISSTKEFQLVSTDFRPQHISEIRYRISTNPDPIVTAASAAIEKICQKESITCTKINLEPKNFMDIFDKNRPAYAVDIATIFTTILIEAPLNDLKFMIHSQEGIRLPDLRGRIAKELSKSKPDLDIINSVLWEEDIIWPIGHFSLGLWHTEKISFEQYNRNQPPIDISWLNHK